MPVVFLGHGSPMNAISDNAFTRMLRILSARIPKPAAILCVSAHWITEGTWITHMPKPKTIHDFYGFPKELFEIEYPAPGSPDVADSICASVPNPRIIPDDILWGFDHGAWSVLRHIYPRAEIPVLQLSVYLGQPAQYHFELGQKLRALRDTGILIVGSGNIVHNLSQIRWEEDVKPHDWAVDFDQWVRDRLLQRNFTDLVEKFGETQAGRLSVPTPDHYFPLLYVLGASDDRDQLRFDYEEIQNGAISMRCVRSYTED